MSRDTGCFERIRDEAEGSDRLTDQSEPQSPVRTGTVPAIRTGGRYESPSSETGLTQAVNLSAEGIDQTDAQDASRLPEESDTEPVPVHSRRREEDMQPILIVEDTVELAEVMQATIQSMGYDAVYETHGARGLERIKTLQPQLILLDIGLPDITGWKMLDNIKEHYTDHNLPLPQIIVVTAYGDPANRLIGRLQNVHSYLIKPFTPDNVERLVQKALNGEKPSSDDPASA